MTPALSRRITSDTGSKLIIPIPNSKQGIHFPILIYWLMGWTFGELATVNEINHRGLNNSDKFFLAWALLWTIIGTGTLFDLLWQLWGRQALTIDRVCLMHRRGLLGLYWVKRYELTHVHNIRAVLGSKPGGYGRIITFDYAGNPVQLGSNIDEMEAKQIATIIRKYTQINRYPERQIS
jgi:hypothetical protein